MSVKNTKFLSLGDLARMTPQDIVAKLPKTPNVTIDRRRLVLVFGPNYELDLERCRNATELVDWIFQIYDKPWMTPELLKEVLLALNRACWICYGESVQCVFCHGDGEPLDWRNLLPKKHAPRLKPSQES